MTLQLIGTLMEVKPTEREDKFTKKVTYATEIQVMFNGIDEEGYKKMTLETISLDEDYADKLEDKIGSTICVSYNVMHTAKGTYVFPDTSMPVLELDKNPLDYSAYARKSQSAKSASKA
ncbi:hypothetical protein [Sulfurimonas sp.]